LLIIAVLVDGSIHPSEPAALKKQAHLIVSSIGVNANTDESLVSALHAHINETNMIPTLDNEGHIKNIALQITDEELRLAVLSGIISICYSDDEYHADEKKFVKLIQTLWNM